MVVSITFDGIFEDTTYHQKARYHQNGGMPIPKRIAPLSDTTIRNEKPRDKDYKLSDGFGLHLLITPTGGKLWRMQYRFNGKQKLLALGQYPVAPGIGGLADGMFAALPLKPDRSDSSIRTEDHGHPYRFIHPLHQGMLRKIPTTLPMMVTSPEPSRMMIGAMLGFLGCSRIWPCSR